MEKSNKRLKNQNKKEKFRLKRIRGYLVIITVLFCTGYLIYYLGKDPYFNIETINIKGTYYLEQDEVLKASGLTKGININKIKIDYLKKQIMTLPRVKNVKVVKDYPKTLDITIEEYPQIALFKNSGNLYELTSNGNTFDCRKGATKYDYPVLSGYEVNSEDFTRNRGFIIDFIDVLASESELYYLISEVDFSNDKYIKLLLRNKKIALLRKEKYSLDLRRLEIILKNFELGENNVIDLRFSERAYLRSYL